MAKIELSTHISENIFFTDEREIATVGSGMPWPLRHHCVLKAESSYADVYGVLLLENNYFGVL